MAADRKPPTSLPYDEPPPPPLSRREHRGSRGGKIHPGTGRGLVPNPRQYSTRRRG